jgi:hypothetical protein
MALFVFTAWRDQVDGRVCLHLTCKPTGEQWDVIRRRLEELFDDNNEVAKTEAPSQDAK